MKNTNINLKWEEKIAERMFKATDKLLNSSEYEHSQPLIQKIL